MADNKPESFEIEYRGSEKKADEIEGSPLVEPVNLKPDLISGQAMVNNRDFEQLVITPVNSIIKPPMRKILKI